VSGTKYVERVKRSACLPHTKNIQSKELVAIYEDFLMDEMLSFLLDVPCRPADTYPLVGSSHAAETAPLLHLNNRIVWSFVEVEERRGLGVLGGLGVEGRVRS
jgi:hypothetical protein